MVDDQVPDDVALARWMLELTAPPGFEVLDVWRCDSCCDDVHASILGPPGSASRRSERRGASRRRRRGGRRG